MPNWCNNTITVTHKDPAVLEALAVAVREGHFCNHIIPVPESLHITAGRDGADGSPEQDLLEARMKENIEKHGYANWYDFCVAKWGTKWDVEPYDTVEFDDQHDKNRVTFGFDSAWSPPIGVYQALEEQGFAVRAYYYESGMCFAGKYEDGFDDYYELGNMSSEEVRETLPQDLDEMMGISESIAQYEEDEAEEE